MRLSRLPGVRRVGVHYVTATALVQWDPLQCDAAAIAGSVRGAGYRPLARNDPAEISGRLDSAVRKLSLRLVVALAFGMWSMACALVLYLDPRMPADVAWWIALASGILAAPVVIVSGADVLRMALRSVRLGAPGLDLLIALGTGGALAASAVSLIDGRSTVYFDTATMLITLLLVGRLIETRARRDAARATEALGRPFEDTAERLRADGGFEPAEAETLEPGDFVRVQAGAVSTVDGVITEGDSRLDTAVLTGESTPRTVGPGDRLAAGHLNLSRPLMIRVDRIAGDRDIDRMGGRIALEIAARGEPVDQVNGVAAGLTRLLPIVALCVAIGATILTGSVTDGLMRGLLVLLVACPCALAIAAPLVHLRAASLAERAGIRIAEPAALDRMAAPRAVVFDKTGTLTLGRPHVVAIDPAPGWTAGAVLALAAQAETGLDHPLARAILDRHGGPVGPGGERDGRTAQTLAADGCRIRVAASPIDAASEAAQGAHTRLTVWRDEVAIGALSLADALDPEASQTVAALKRRGLDLWLATGDGEGPARAIAAAVGIRPDRVRWGCSPLSKAELVRGLDGPVMVVGDGVNDGPALAAADCGVSVRRAHPAAAATAAVVLTRGGLSCLPLALDLAVRTRSRLRQNIFLAVGYNLIALPAAALGLLTPAGAAVAMVLSSLAVTANAMRLSLPAQPGDDMVPNAASFDPRTPPSALSAQT